MQHEKIEIWNFAPDTILLKSPATIILVTWFKKSWSRGSATQKNRRNFAPDALNSKIPPSRHLGHVVKKEDFQKSRQPPSRGYTKKSSRNFAPNALNSKIPPSRHLGHVVKKEDFQKSRQPPSRGYTKKSSRNLAPNACSIQKSRQAAILVTWLKKRIFKSPASRHLGHVVKKEDFQKSRQAAITWFCNTKKLSRNCHAF